MVVDARILDPQAPRHSRRLAPARDLDKRRRERTGAEFPLIAGPELAKEDLERLRALRNLFGMSARTFENLW